MQCRDAQFYLRLRRPAGDELGADVSADLDRHLAGCPGCAADARAAGGFDAAVAAAVRAVPVPAGLHDRLRTAASAHAGAVIRRRAYRVTALAASLLLAVGLGFGVFSVTRPQIDSYAVVGPAEGLVSDPDAVLKTWLAERKLPPQLPAPFDPDLLVMAGSERVQGVDVPVAVFRHPDDPKYFARLYAFRADGTLNLDGLRNDFASNTAVTVIPTDARQFRGVRYVVVTRVRNPREDPLKPYLRTAGTARR
ncbi:MAG: hypothetical protein C0501_09975 [Isosphaera sp.]|nr:hypothetical protein [Isosphaera sp.]